MKILLKHATIDYTHYDSVILHETFSVISFRVKGEIEEKGLQLPLVFQNSRDAREAYRRILQGRNCKASSISISEYNCSWPMETALKVEQYAQALYDFDRPMTI